MSQPSLFQLTGTFGKLVAIANIVVLVALPISWFIPLLRSSAFLFLNSEISIWRAAWELSKSDLFLFFVVLIFAMVVPILKTLLYVFLWFAPLKKRPTLSWIGTVAAKLSMTDVFLFAISIVGIKGLGVGRITPLVGMYVFSLVVILSLLVSTYTEVQSKRLS